MPIPFLIAGLGIAAGVLGVGGHLDAKEVNEKAQGIANNAKKLYSNAKDSLEKAQKQTEESVLKLGYEKQKILDSSMKQFLNSYDKIKHISVIEPVGLNELSNFTIDQQGAIQLREMSNIYKSSVKIGLAGVVGAEIASSTFVFGATITPLAAVAAPVVLFTGISASIKADENLEKANTMYAEAEAAVEKMKVSETLCGAISDRSEMFNDLLIELDGMFSECASLLEDMVRKKEERIVNKELTSADFSEEDLKLMAITRALAGAVKSIIVTPILTKEGTVSNESEEIYDKTVRKLADFRQVVETIDI